MDKNILTESDKIGKLSIKEKEIKESKSTGRLILIVDVNCGGISNVQEFIKSDT
jgi:hypothetical protein